MFECELLQWEVQAYVWSLALQVAGAVLLIIKYFSNTNDRLLDEYYHGGGVIIKDPKSEEVILYKDRLQQCAKNIYDNRMSFIYIAAGYILSIFGDKNNACNICILATLASFVIALILLEKMLAICIAKIVYKKDKPIKYSEMGDRINYIITAELEK